VLHIYIYIYIYIYDISNLRVNLVDFIAAIADKHTSTLCMKVFHCVMRYKYGTVMMNPIMYDKYYIVYICEL